MFIGRQGFCQIHKSIRSRPKRSDHIESLVHGLRQFSQETITPIDNDNNAMDAICSFLAEFDVICLRAYLRGTVYPAILQERMLPT